MNEQVSPSVDNENNQPLAPLVERLDPSIGELSTMMGAMMTELLRRTLRGSVRQIDEELQGEVAQKVDATIADRLPAIEQSAAAAADKTAREAATEVAVEEVHALEQRTKETHRAIADRIDSSARAAAEKTAQAERVLTNRIDLAERNAERAITTKATELTSHIEAAAKSATSLTEEKARELARTIEEAERRANETAQAEAARQVDDLLQRSKKTTAGLRDRIQTLEGNTAELAQRFDQALRTVLERIDKADQRLTEVEKPRGLRALWLWLLGCFGKKGKRPPDHA